MIVSRLPRFATQLVRWGLPRRALLFGPLSLGDDLLCTAVLHEARRRGQPFAMLSNRPELFANNPDPERVLPVDDFYAAGLRRLGSRVVQPYYAQPADDNPARDTFAPGHIIAEMCRLAGISGKVELRPRLFLTDAEKSSGSRCVRQIAIHSSATAARLPFETKEWGLARFTDLVRLLTPDFELVQLGSPSDPLLPGVLDLRGRTTLREAAAVLHASLAFVGLEGFLAHLARSVDCPGVVVFGGRVRPETCGYTANRNFYGAVPCAPCGLRSGCPNSMICMDAIAPPDVARAVREFASSPPTRPLAADTATIT